MDDIALLREYVERNSEEAFAALVARHVNKVYSVALRHTRNAHSAGEITQAVFVILAMKSASLGQRVVLSGWLYETARLTSLTFIRGEIRRARREQEAHMQTWLNEEDSDVWRQIAPLLDAAMAGLSETDRHAVVLRFFDGKSLREVGAALGANEAAAEKRVSRALKKLQRFFLKRGVTSTTATLAGAISANSVQTAPVALAKSVTAVAMVKGTAAGSSTLTLIQGALKIMAWTKMKTAVVVVGGVLLAAGMATTMVVQHQHQTKLQPRASWTFAGYADPPSALMSFLFVSAGQSNRTMFEASLTPDQLSLYQRIISRNTELPTHLSEAAVVADIFKRASEQWQTGSYRILKEQAVAADQTILRLHVQNSKQNKDVAIKMKKIGGEWKYDGFQP